MSRNTVRLILALAILCLILSFFCLECREEIEEAPDNVTVVETVIEEVEEVEEEISMPTERVIQDCIVTAYCCENYPHICNDGDATYTATMTTPTPGRTIAVDPREIPYGTEVVIDGHTYIAEDCGGAIKGEKRIDLLFATHREALEWGVQTRSITIKERM